MKHTTTVMLASLLAFGCHKPPEAPKELEDLCAYLFAHSQDEDDAELTDAVANLGSWLQDGKDDLGDGYTINNLTQSSLDALDDHDRDASAVVGAAIDTQSDLPLTDVIGPLITGDQMAIYPDTYSYFQRSFDSDPDCFVGQTCDRVEFENESTATLPLGIDLDCKHHSQDRWVTWDQGDVLVHRAWLKDPAKGGILSVNAQYFLAVTFPWDGGLLRMQSLWADAEIVGANIPQATLLNMLVGNLQDLDGELYDYAAQN